MKTKHSWMQDLWYNSQRLSFLIMLDSCCRISARDLSEIFARVRQILVPRSRQFCTSFRHLKDFCRMIRLEAGWNRIGCHWRAGSRRRLKSSMMMTWARTGCVNITTGWCLRVGISRSPSPMQPVPRCISSAYYKCWHVLCWTLTWDAVSRGHVVVIVTWHVSAAVSNRMGARISSTYYRQADGSLLQCY